MPSLFSTLSSWSFFLLALTAHVLSFLQVGHAVNLTPLVAFLELEDS